MKKYWGFFVLFLFLSFLPSYQANAEQQTERVIVVFKEEIDSKLVQQYAEEVFHTFDDLAAVSMTVPSSMIDELKLEEEIERVDLDPVVKTSSQTADWGYQKVNAPVSKTYGWTGRGVKVGVLDTGVDTHHPDLKLAGGVSFVEGVPSYEDDHGHGTHVAGIIGAQDNDVGVVGVAPEAELYAIKVLDHFGQGNQSDVVAGIEWAIENNLDIINLSLTASEGSYLLSETLKKAYDHGILIVAASGNSLSPIQSTQDVLFPARYPTVIAVGAIDQQNERAAFSYYGNSLELMAPGVNILSTSNGSEEYMLMNGTSMAAPFVSGVAALYKQAYPQLSHEEIRNLMQKNAIDLGVSGKDASYGYGLIQGPTELSAVKVFPDVSTSAWYADEIKYLYNEGFINGKPDGLFHPEDQVTRAEAITMIGRALGYSNEQMQTSYKDVSVSSYASGYIQQASNNQIVTGYPDGTFRPNANIIRHDVAVMLQKAFNLQTGPYEPFQDVPENKYFSEAVYSLKTNGITTGYPDGTFQPTLPITRAEFALFLARVLEESFRS
jgi:hypothetical protein